MVIKYYSFTTNSIGKIISLNIFQLPPKETPYQKYAVDSEFMSEQDEHEYEQAEGDYYGQYYDDVYEAEYAAVEKVDDQRYRPKRAPFYSRPPPQLQNRKQSTTTVSSGDHHIGHRKIYD